MADAEPGLRYGARRLDPAADTTYAGAFMCVLRRYTNRVIILAQVCLRRQQTRVVEPSPWQLHRARPWLPPLCLNTDRLPLIEMTVWLRLSHLPALARLGGHCILVLRHIKLDSSHLSCCTQQQHPDMMHPADCVDTFRVEVSQGRGVATGRVKVHLRSRPVFGKVTGGHAQTAVLM